MASYIPLSKSDGIDEPGVSETPVDKPLVVASNSSSAHARSEPTADHPKQSSSPIMISCDGQEPKSIAGLSSSLAKRLVVAVCPLNR